MRLKPKRLVLLLVAGFLLVCGVPGYLYLWQNRPVGHGPAGPPISRELFSRVWTEKPVWLIGMGDSVTAGFGARKGYSYFDRLVANPTDESEPMRGVCLRAVLPGLQFTNLAVSGSVSQEHVEKQLPHLGTRSNVIGIVVITTGGNDLIHNYGRTPPREQAMYGASWSQAEPWVRAFEQRLEFMATQIGNSFPDGCHIFLANIYDPTDGRGDIERAGLPAWKDGMKILKAYNQVIEQFAEKHRNVHLVNMHQAFLGHGIHCTQFWLGHYDSKDAHYWYYENLEDPNERGYDAIRRLFLIEIAKIADQLN